MVYIFLPLCINAQINLTAFSGMQGTGQSEMLSSGLKNELTRQLTKRWTIFSRTVKAMMSSVKRTLCLFRKMKMESLPQ